MYFSVVFMSLVILSTLMIGFYYQMHPTPEAAQAVAMRRLKIVFSINVISFVGGLVVLLLMALQTVMAEPAVTGATKEISMGLGLGIIGAGIPAAMATLGAGLAVGPIGAAALAVVVEKPEALGRSLIFIGLAEGIAIYGVVVTVLLLDKL